MIILQALKLGPTVLTGERPGLRPPIAVAAKRAGCCSIAKRRVAEPKPHSLDRRSRDLSAYLAVEISQPIIELALREIGVDLFTQHHLGRGGRSTSELVCASASSPSRSADISGLGRRRNFVPAAKASSILCGSGHSRRTDFSTGLKFSSAYGETGRGASLPPLRPIHCLVGELPDHHVVREDRSILYSVIDAGKAAGRTDRRRCPFAEVKWPIPAVRARRRSTATSRGAAAPSSRCAAPRFAASAKRPGGTLVRKVVSMRISRLHPGACAGSARRRRPLSEGLRP